MRFLTTWLFYKMEIQNIWIASIMILKVVIWKKKQTFTIISLIQDEKNKQTLINDAYLQIVPFFT